MIYSIFRNNEFVIGVKPNNNSELSQKQQSEDIIRLNFTLDSYIGIEIGDYIFFEKTRQFYFLNKKPRVIESPKNYQYECIFEGRIHELKKTKILLQTEKGDGFYQDYKFPLTGNAQTFLSFIVNNLNRNGGEYTVGKWKETDTRTIAFNNWAADQAIFKLSEELGFSWYLEGTELNFDSKAFNTAYVFQVGRKAGFTALTRTRVASATIQTVVYGYGATGNLPPRTSEEGETYDSTLLTENRLFFEGVDEESKLENNVDIFGRIESVQEFNDIKPERTGTVTDIDTEDIRSFFDEGIDFDINEQLLAGIKPKINFLTGSLIGLNFDISYDTETKKITMDLYSDESGEYPNETIFAALGDQYKLFDLVMPDAYIQEATTRLQEATQDYLDTHSKVLELYEGAIDEEYIEANNVELDLGDLIRVVSNPFGIDNLYEIKELVQNINNPNKYTIKFGDVLPKSLLGTLKSVNFATEQTIYNIEKNTYSTTETTNQVTNIVTEGIEWQTL